MYVLSTLFVLSNFLLLGFFIISEILQNPEVCLLFLLIFSNVFQTSFPRVQDVWLANFDNQLAACFEPVQQEVVVPPRADQQLLHGDVPASLPGMGGGDAVLAVQDAAVATVVVTEPAVSNTPLGVGVRDAALVVQEGDAHHVPASDEAPRQQENCGMRHERKQRKLRGVEWGEGGKKLEFWFGGHFSPRSSYLKMALKIEFFDFFQMLCF